MRLRQELTSHVDLLGESQRHKRLTIEDLMKASSEEGVYEWMTGLSHHLHGCQMCFDE